MSKNMGIVLRFIVVVYFMAGVTPYVVGGETHILSFEQCIEYAMDHSHKRPASQYAVVAAEALHKQALSAYWPQVTLQGKYELTDEPFNNIFPAANVNVPAQSIGIPSSSFKTPSMSVTIPANAFGPGFPPQNVQMPVASQTVNVPAQTFHVPPQSFIYPEQNIKLQDEESWYATLSAQWLLWDGGKRKGMREQARAGVEVANQELRRTDLEITDSVTRTYYGAVLAQQICKIGEDTLARMEATLSLTESMYKNGSGSVKKTDYLNNKIMVETLRSTVALLHKNIDMAQAALAYTIGFKWDDSVVPKAEEIPYKPSNVDLNVLVSGAYNFSPVWKSLEAGIRAAEGALREAKSEYYPKLAFTGDVHKWWNDYDYGLATEENKEGWIIGVGLEIPLFRGFRTRNQGKVARAKLDKINEERILLQEGIGIQIRSTVMDIETEEKRYQATLDAMTTAVENQELNNRAYQNDLVETEDVIQSQLMEALMTVQHYKVCFDHARLLSHLNLLVGTECKRRAVGSKVDESEK